MLNYTNMKNILRSDDLNYRYESHEINSLEAHVINFCKFLLIGPSYRRFTCLTGHPMKQRVTWVSHIELIAKPNLS